jgi:hypothetical protein
VLRCPSCSSATVCWHWAASTADAVRLETCTGPLCETCWTARHRVLLVGSLRAACRGTAKAGHTTSPLTAWSIHPRHTPKRAASLPGSTATTCSSQDGWQHWSTLRSAAERLWARLDGTGRRRLPRRSNPAAPQRMCKRKRLRRMESAAQRQAPGCGGGDGEGQSRTRRPSNLIPALCGAIIRHCNRTATTTRTCMQAHTRELASLRASQCIL